MAQTGHQPRRIDRISIGKDIHPLTIINTGMDVHATAGNIGKRLGHKRGAKTVLSGNTFNDSPKQQGMCAGQHCILLVVRIDLPLPRGKFAMNRGHRNTLQFAGDPDVIEKRITIKEVIGHTVLNAFLLQCRARNVPTQRRGAILIGIGEQIKLELGSDCRRQPHCFEAGQYRLQRLARINPIKRAIILRISHEDLRYWRVVPGDQRKCASHGANDLIRIPPHFCERNFVIPITSNPQKRG